MQQKIQLNKEVIRKIKYELTQSLVNWDVPPSYRERA